MSEAFEISGTATTRLSDMSALIRFTAPRLMLVMLPFCILFVGLNASDASRLTWEEHPFMALFEAILESLPVIVVTLLIPGILYVSMAVQFYRMPAPRRQMTYRVDAEGISGRSQDGFAFAVPWTSVGSFYQTRHNLVLRIDKRRFCAYPLRAFSVADQVKLMRFAAEVVAKRKM